MLLHEVFNNVPPGIHIAALGVALQQRIVSGALRWMPRKLLLEKVQRSWQLLGFFGYLEQERDKEDDVDQLSHITLSVSDGLEHGFRRLII